MRLAAGANRLAQAGVAAPLGSGGVTRNTTFGFITSKCRVRHAAASVVTLAATTPSSGAGSRRAAARRAEDRRLMAAILHGHDRLVRRREGRNSKPRDYPEACRSNPPYATANVSSGKASGGAVVALSKVQSVDQRMRLECGVGFRQLLTCRRTRPGQLSANKRLCAPS